MHSRKARSFRQWGFSGALHGRPHGKDSGVLPSPLLEKNYGKWVTLPYTIYMPSEKARTTELNPWATYSLIVAGSAVPTCWATVVVFRSAVAHSRMPLNWCMSLLGVNMLGMSLTTSVGFKAVVAQGAGGSSLHNVYQCCTCLCTLQCGRMTSLFPRKAGGWKLKPGWKGGGLLGDNDCMWLQGLRQTIVLF